MATIALAPLVLKDVLLTVGTDNYEKAVDSVTFTPASSTVPWTGLDGTTYTDQTTATWTATLNYMQDWDTADSLSAYLMDNEGTSVALTFKPRSASGPTFTATAIITPGAIGGQVNANATTSVTLGLTGAPARVASGAVPTIVTALPSAAAETEIVTITGTGFTGTTAVTFGGTAASDFVVLSSTVLVATMPAGSAGSAAIIVTNATGASSSFTYTRGA